MRVLVACEFSGVVRQAFHARGHDAWSCDLIPSQQPGKHVTGDVRKILGRGWDLMIAFPPCDHLSNAGARYWREKQADGRQDQALNFVRELMAAPVERIAIENPVGRISTAIRKPDQIIQPWQYGEPYIKTTCLWLKNLPRLQPTKTVKPVGYWVGGDAKKYGRNRNPQKRALTFPGIAEAMADQWGESNG